MNYFVGRNLVPKLLAVLVALVIWVFVMNEQNPPLDGTFQVALSSRNLAEDMLVVEAPTTVRSKSEVCATRLPEPLARISRRLSMSRDWRPGSTACRSRWRRRVVMKWWKSTRTR